MGEFLTITGYIKIKELSFDDEDEEGYDYTATLSYKTKDLIEKFLKDKTGLH